MNISVRRTVRILSCIAGFLLLSGLATQYYAFLYVPDQFQSRDSHGIIRLFFLDGEANIPAWFQTTMLLLCSILLFAISARKKTMLFYRHWLALAFVFLFLSLDEAASFHEGAGNQLSKLMHSNLFVYAFAWVVPGAVITALFVIGYWKFLNHLSRVTMQRFLAAGAIYVSGALGFETFAAWLTAHYGSGNLVYTIETFFEEGLEMCGIILFMRALLLYLQAEITRECSTARPLELLIEG